MSKKQFLALLTAVVMVLSIVPVLSFAAESALTCTDSYITSTATSGTYTQDGFTDRPYALSWAGGTGGGYRTGVIAFDASAIDKSDVIAAAKLSLTVYKTQNINQSGANSTVTVYAFDPAMVDSTNAVKPANGKKVGVMALTGAPTQSTNVNMTFTADLDLASYFEDYPSAQKIALYVANRDDIAECNSFGLVGFYGKNDTSYAPKLTLTTGKAASVVVKFADKDGNTLKADETVTGLFSGDVFTPSDAVAPQFIVKDGVTYSKLAPSAMTLAAGENIFTVTYSDDDKIVSVAAPTGEYSAIFGNEPMLPKTLTATLKNGGTTTVDVSWAPQSMPTAVTEPVKVTYVGTVTGFDDVTAEVNILPCDHLVQTVYGAGNSDGAGFVWYNYLDSEISAGEVVFETDLTITEGTNKLLTYGNVSTTSFGGAAVALRFMSADTFEYYNGSWQTSSVKCETGKTYRIRTEVSMTNKTYRIFVIDENGNESEVTNGSAAFRNASITSIDRMFIHGCGEGVIEGVISGHRTYWKNGYSYLDVSFVANNGTIVREPYTAKVGTGTTYYVNDAAKLIAKDGKTYLLENVDTTPSHKVSGESDSFVVNYNVVEIQSIADSKASLVKGDATINLPASVNVIFSDGQKLKFNVTWDTSYVDVNEVGEYNVEGVVEGSTIKAKAVVSVKEVQNNPKTTTNTVATNNGGWNWYVEPSGTHIQPGDNFANLYEKQVEKEDGTTRYLYTSNNGYKFQHDRTYMGWVEDGGDIVVSQLDHETGEYKRVVIHRKLESDDHNNPAVVVLPDGRIMAVYSMHTNESYMYYRVTKNPEDISEWNAEQYYLCKSVTPDDTDTYNATYPSVFMVHDDGGVEGNDVIYMGWRGVHWKPTFAKFSMPDENGVCETVMNQTQFANTTYNYSTYDGNDAPNAKTDGGKTDSGRRPYTKYDYDYERNKIYITFTANHPDNDRRNHIFYVELNIADQGLYTSKGTFLQPLPFENQQTYRTQGALDASGNHTNGQWGVLTDDLHTVYPELVVFDASQQTGQDWNPRNGNVERRGWTWDIAHNEKGEPCIVYVDVTATPPGENGALPTWYVEANDDFNSDRVSRSHHYYWYARWDSETEQWINTFLTYGGKWWHQNYGQERCYSGGLTLDHNYPGNVIFMSVPVQGEYGNIFEIVRWESDDDGATWTKREPITKDSKIVNARPNVIYNYKMNEDGTNAGPRLLWKSGEYRYWMNYEYKTGVWTDWAEDGFITQDDPEMFADGEIYLGGEKLEALPVGNATLNAKFTVSNISIGDGMGKFALAHYDKDGKLKGVKSVDETIPARSVPQIGMVGAPKLADDGRNSPWALEDNRAPMGDPEVIIDIDYTADFEEGDKVSLFAWDNGIELAMESIMTVPYSVTTSGSEYLMRETFTYDGTKKLTLDQDENTFNGWLGKGYSTSATVAFDDNSYAAITKAPFGNTGLHLYKKGGEGIMASHALPDTNGEDYTIEFTIRYINELSWNNTDNAGFTLSHGVPAYRGDSTSSSSAFQFRHTVQWQDENGRGTNGKVRDTRAFDGGSQTTIFHGGIPRTIDTTDMERADYNKGEGYYDTATETYIHDYNDSLMVGSLYKFVVSVSPAKKEIMLSVNDGYRTVYYTTDYVDAASYDWDSNPIDTITFSVGNEKWGEIYVDDICVYKGTSDSIAQEVTLSRADKGALNLGSGVWNKVKVGNGVYVFYDKNGGNAIDVNGQSTSVGASVGTYAYNGGDNQKFSIEETAGGVLIKGKQSNLYLSVSNDGSVTLQEKENATVFVMEETGVTALSLDEVESIVMLAEANSDAE